MSNERGALIQARLSKRDPDYRKLSEKYDRFLRAGWSPKQIVLAALTDLREERVEFTRIENEELLSQHERIEQKLNLILEKLNQINWANASQNSFEVGTNDDAPLFESLSGLVSMFSE